VFQVHALFSVLGRIVLKLLLDGGQWCACEFCEYMCHGCFPCLCVEIHYCGLRLTAFAKGILSEYTVYKYSV